MPKTLQTVRTIEAMRQWVARWRAQGMRSAVVPTMGALHDGHLRLVEQALRTADRVVVTIFVNPAQFAPGEDLDAYPRTEKSDLAKLRAAGAHVAFVPHRLEMYPEGYSATVSMGGPARVGVGRRLRALTSSTASPTVVAKLFNAAGCDYAMFGEKDYQQLKVVTAMARDLAIPTIVVGVATVREADGLAMSSRNAYLSADERQIAPIAA
jgi:pantoate--beta-alanine ligase